jgi:hypothetical protein
MKKKFGANALNLADLFIFLKVCHFMLLFVLGTGTRFFPKSKPNGKNGGKRIRNA